jgi:hypothetical protein
LKENATKQVENDQWHFPSLGESNNKTQFENARNST